MIPKTKFGRLQGIALLLISILALALALATLLSGPRPVAAQSDWQRSSEEEEVRIGLPAYLPSDPIGRQRVLYADSSISLNTTCPVRKSRVDPNRDPVYVNGRAVAFCCHPCPSVFSQNPERYLREMKVSLRDPVNPTRRAIFDSSVRVMVNQDIFFFSSLASSKRFQKDPLRYCGALTDPVTHARFHPTRRSPHVTFRGREYWFSADSTLARFQSEPEKYFERLAGT